MTIALVNEFYHFSLKGFQNSIIRISFVYEKFAFESIKPCTWKMHI